MTLPYAQCLTNLLELDAHLTLSHFRAAQLPHWFGALGLRCVLASCSEHGGVKGFCHLLPLQSLRSRTSATPALMSRSGPVSTPVMPSVTAGPSSSMSPEVSTK